MKQVFVFLLVIISVSVQAQRPNIRLKVNSVDSALYATHHYVDSVLAAGGSGITTISTATDVDTSGIADGDVLLYDAILEKWKAATPNYINNQSAAMQSGEFWINGYGRATAFYLQTETAPSDHGSFANGLWYGSTDITNLSGWNKVTLWSKGLEAITLDNYVNIQKPVYFDDGRVSAYSSGGYDVLVKNQGSGFLEYVPKDSLGGNGNDTAYVSLTQIDDTTVVFDHSNRSIAPDTLRIRTISLQSNTTLSTLTDGATVTWDYSTQGTEAKVTIAGNRTLSITNLPAGKVVYLTLEVVQDATGSRTLTWPTVKWIGGTAPTLTTAGGSIDLITFRWNGTTLYGTYGNDYK